jgi:anti-sigma factor RsiW
MADDHFSRETLERFLRSELSREETRGLVRHLLRRCPQCSRLLQEVSQRDNFQLLLRGLEDAALRTDPDREQLPLARISIFPSREARAGPEGDAKRRGRLGRS